MNELDRYAVSLENMEVLRAQVEALEAWKAEELALMNPLMDYARSVCTGQLGCSLTEWLVEDHKAQAREIERLNGTLTLVREQRDAELIANDILERELAALKAQPGGVVQWPDADEIMQMAFEEGQPTEDASGYYFELEEFDLFVQRLLDEVARLNSPPVSAGERCMCGGSPHTGQCLYEHFLSYSGLTDQPLLRYAYFHGAGFAAEIDQPSAGVMDERE